MCGYACHICSATVSVWPDQLHSIHYCVVVWNGIFLCRNLRHSFRMNLGLEMILTHTKPHIYFVHPLTVRSQWRKHIFVLCSTASMLALMSSQLCNNEPDSSVWWSCCGLDCWKIGVWLLLGAELFFTLPPAQWSSQPSVKWYQRWKWRHDIGLLPLSGNLTGAVSP